MGFLTTSIASLLLFWSGAIAIPLETRYNNDTTTTFTSTRTSTLIVTETAPAIIDGSSCPLKCIYGPIPRAYYTWSQFVELQTVATVVFIINDSDGTTQTTTNFVSSYLINGTAPTNSLPPRTDTNAAGTVTAVINVFNDDTSTFAYPTPYYGTGESWLFEGTLPYSSKDVMSCVTGSGYTALPPHAPYATPTVPVVDPEDPFGLRYLLQEIFNVPALEADYVATEFPGAVVDVAFRSCESGIFAAPATQATGVSFLTATASVHISAAAAGASQPVPQPAETGAPNPGTEPAQTAALSAPAQTAAPGAGNPPTNTLSVIGNNPVPNPDPAVSLPVPEPNQGTPGQVSPDSNPLPNSPAPAPAPAPPAQGGGDQPAPQPVPEPAPEPNPQPAPAGSEFTSGFVQGGQTLVPGGPAITVSGAQISLPTQGAPEASGVPGAIVIPSSEPQAPGPGGDAPPQNTVAGASSNPSVQTPAPAPEGTFVFGAQTLVPGGPAITVSGVPISLATGETAVVAGTGGSASTVTTDIGGYITSSLGGSGVAGPTSATGGTATASTDSTANGFDGNGGNQTASASVELSTGAGAHAVRRTAGLSEFCGLFSLLWAVWTLL